MEMELDSQEDSNFQERFRQLGPERQQTTRRSLAKRLREAKLIKEMAASPGWQVWSTKTRAELEQIGKAVVYPGIKSDRRDDVLSAAKERMKVILEIERAEEQYKKLYARYKSIK